MTKRLKGYARQKQLGKQWFKGPEKTHAVTAYLIFSLSIPGGGLVLVKNARPEKFPQSSPDCESDRSEL